MVRWPSIGRGRGYQRHREDTRYSVHGHLHLRLYLTAERQGHRDVAGAGSRTPCNRRAACNRSRGGGTRFNDARKRGERDSGRSLTGQDNLSPRFTQTFRTELQRIGTGVASELGPLGGDGDGDAFAAARSVPTGIGTPLASARRGVGSAYACLPIPEWRGPGIAISSRRSSHARPSPADGL